VIARSLLFVPATRPDRFAGAAASGADVVIVDLEDAVPPAGKDAARGHAVAWLATPGGDGPTRALRINSPRTAEGLRDVVALVDRRVAPDLLVVPKVDHAAELALLAGVLDGAAADVRFLPLVETARGLGAADAIAAAPRVAGLVLGGADLAADLGCAFAWEPLLFARARLVQAAATAGVAAIDFPWLDVAATAGLADEVAAVRRLGFAGKLAIHPKHVAAINAGFAPTADEVARAERIVAAAAAGDGVCVVDGRMVDAPVVRAAQRALALARRAR